MTDYRPPRQQTVDRSISIFTFEDAVEQVLAAYRLNRDPMHVTQARRAVIDAYRDLPQQCEWPFFKRRWQFRTVAPQTTGTITYDHTGGSSERLLTLSGATFPTNAVEYGVYIGTEQYAIESYIDSTNVTLSAEQNPGADIASGTSYRLYKALYPLPVDFRRGSQIIDLTGGTVDPCYADAHVVLHGQYSNALPAEPQYYTIIGGEAYYGGMAILFGPPPSTEVTFDLVYDAIPRPLFYERYSDGTVAVSSQAVTGTNTAFDARMKGSIIRFPDSTKADDLPTSIVGTVDGNINPYVAERVITAVGTTTGLTIDSTISETVSGARYTISDPVDFEPYVMRTAFVRMAEMYYAIYTNKEGQRGYRTKLYREALMTAMENRSRMREEPVDASIYPWNYSVTINTNSS